jgi:deoxyribonuclease V
MRTNYDHLSFAEAKSLQDEWRKQLVFGLPDGFSFDTIAGADISFDKGSNVMHAAIVVLSYPQLVLQSYSLASTESNFPYKPGYLGFREVPAILKAWEQLEVKPGVTVLDGQGILHPRRMGIAAHFGVLTGAATIGCAKSSLYGVSEELGLFQHESQVVYENDVAIGYALRTKDRTKPIFVSPGYGLSLPNSLSIVKKCIKKHRMPDPTRIAHDFANDFRTGKLTAGLHHLAPALTLF